MKIKISSILMEASNLFSQLENDDIFKENIISISIEIIKSLKSGNKVLFFGNGGSAADSQHMAGEFVSKFKFNRKSMPAIALTTDSSIITSISNDFGYEKIFSKQIEGLGNKSDIAFAFSTSGNSKNVLEGLKKAKEQGLRTIGLTGLNGGLMKNFCDYIIKIPSSDVPRIQEGHLLVGHIICEIVEKEMFPNE